MGAVLCSAREAYKLIDRMDENDTVVLTMINTENFIHGIPKKIKKKQGKALVGKAKNIFFQDNDFFGVLSLYGIVKDKDVIYNILFLIQ